MNKRTLITTAAAIFAASTFATAAFADGVKCSGTQRLQGPERLQGRQQRLQGPECLQGPGLHRGRRTAQDCTAKGGKVM